VAEQAGRVVVMKKKKREWGIKDRKTLFNQVFFVVKREREREKTRWIWVRHDLEKEKTSIQKTHPFKSCYFGGFCFLFVFTVEMQEAVQTEEGRSRQVSVEAGLRKDVRLSPK